MARSKKPAPKKRDQAPTPDPSAAADRVIGEDEAKAEGKSTPYVRAYRKRKKEKKQEAAAPIEVGPGDVIAATALGNTVWNIIGPFARLRPLDETQKRELGEALAPLVVKYMPILGNWQYEVAAVLTVIGLVQANYDPKVVEDDGATGMEGAGLRSEWRKSDGEVDTGDTNALASDRAT